MVKAVDWTAGVVRIPFRNRLVTIDRVPYHQIPQMFGYRVPEIDSTASLNTIHEA